MFNEMVYGVDPLKSANYQTYPFVINAGTNISHVSYKACLLFRQAMKNVGRTNFNVIGVLVVEYSDGSIVKFAAISGNPEEEWKRINTSKVIEAIKNELMKEEIRS